MKIDRVYYNGVIRTMVSEGDTVEALAVHNGTIVAAGTSKEMRAIDACEYVDLQGRSVLPGFADTHMPVSYTHLVAGNRHLHRYYNFAGRAVETVPRSLRLSCGSELT